MKNTGFNPYYPGIQSETWLGTVILPGRIFAVSILIILEFSQRHRDGSSYRVIALSFNPYYPGIQSETIFAKTGEGAISD